MAAKCIVFTHHKGGTGKTTSCVNIAGELSKKGKKVLVMDTDPQGSATAALGVNKDSLDVSMYDVFLAKCENSKSPTVKDVILETDVENLSLAPASIDMAGLPLIMQNEGNPPKILYEIVKEIKKNYDFILVDTPPSYSLLSINGIVASDHLILPLDTGALSMESIGTFATLLKDIDEELEMKKKVDMVIITEFKEMSFESILTRMIQQVNAFLSASEEFAKTSVDEVRENINLFLSVNNGFVGDVFIVPYSDAVRDSQIRGVPLWYWEPKNRVNRIYEDIANRIIEREKDGK